MKRQVEQAAAEVRARWPGQPRAGIILGTGLGSFAAQIDVQADIDYREIPHFPQATAPGHPGRLVAGTVAGVPVLTMEGRFHRYEGYSLQQITLPVRVMQSLGIECLVISNASGGLNPRLVSGDIVLITDHINLLWDNPLLGRRDAGARAVANDRLSRGCVTAPGQTPYDPQLIQQASTIARAGGFSVYPGVYAALVGPNYETRAEYRLLRRIGADVVGMSTVPEAVVASLMGLRVLALSAVTNVCRPDERHATSGEAVVAAAESTEPKMRAIVTGLLAKLSSGSF